MIKIDKHKVYESHGYHFVNFVDLTLDQKKMVLEWRNHEKVRNMMVNKDIIPLEGHLNFIDGLNDRNDSYYWLVNDANNSPIGVLDLIHVNMSCDSGELGFYLNPDATGLGFEFMIECNFFIYGVLKLGNNHVTVNVNNKEILLFNKYVGTIYEGKEIIGDEVFYVSRHSNGKYILDHYADFSLADYARFIRKNKNSININI